MSTTASVSSTSRPSPSSSTMLRAPLASTSLDLLDRSRGSLLLACRTGDVGERYVEAHLGALRAAAALIAARSLPGSAGAPATSGPSIRSGPAGVAAAGSGRGAQPGAGSGVGSSAGAAASRGPVRGLGVGVGVSRSRPRSVWELLPRVAPELTEWAAFFAASARRRAAVERGVQIVARESDDLLRQAEIFLEIVQDLLGLPRADPLAPMSGYVAPVSRSGWSSGSGRE